MAVTPASPIAELPAPPSRGQAPDIFSAAMDALLSALDPFVGETNAAASATYANAQAAETAAASAESAETAAVAAAAAAVGATGYSATSATSLSIGTGSKVFTTQSGKSFTNGDRVTAISRANPANRMRGTVTYSGTTLTMTSSETEGSGTYADWLLILTALEQQPPYGKQGIWVPASAMVPRNTNGAGVGDLETATNKVNLRTLDLSPSAIEYFQFTIRMPRSWDEGAVTFVPVWLHAATATNFGVVLSMRAVAIGDNEAADAAFGSAQPSVDTGGTTDRIYFGPESGPITIAGTPQPEDLVVFEGYRDVSSGSDTLAVDLRLVGVTIYITTNARNDQ